MGFCSGGWGNWMGWGGGWGGGWTGLILGLALLAGTVVVVGVGAGWFVRQFRRGQVAGGVADDPLEIARRRLASGEITVEEYEGIRHSLRDGN